MPRAKRTKMAQAIPIPRAVEPTSTSKANPKHATISPSSSGRVTNGSDDSDGLVRTNRTGVNRRGVQAQEATMSGALPSVDVIVGGARVRPPTGRKRAVLSRVAREADHARAIEALRARREAAMAAEKGEKAQIPSSIPEENVPPKGQLTNLTKESGTFTGDAMSKATDQWSPGTGLKTREPQRAESSTISASAFKKRPRQPSLLQLLRSQNQDNPSMDNADDDLDDLEDLCPDDESTPFPKLLPQPNLQRSLLTSLSSPQQSSGSRKRKLTPPEVQILASQPHPTQVSLPPQLPDDDLYGVSSQNGEPGFDVSSIELNLPEPTLPPPRSIRTHTPQIWNDTEAPSRSSSSPPQPKNAGNRNTATKSDLKPHTNQKQPSPGLSPVSSTSSSPSPPPVSRPLKPLSTATLQNLLPRRRLRSRPKPVAGAFDIESSDASASSHVEIESVTRGEDEDELSYHSTAKSKKKSQNRRTTTLSRSRKSQPAKSEAASSKTYTRKKTLSNHTKNHIENSDDDDSESLIRATNAVPAKEADAKQRLEAKKKLESVKMHFREVDEWELEVEEVTGEGSSQVDAR